MEAAVVAITAWQSEIEPAPQGWFRDPINGLRRNEDGEIYFAP